MRFRAQRQVIIVVGSVALALVAGLSVTPAAGASKLQTVSSKAHAAHMASAWGDNTWGEIGDGSSKGPTFCYGGPCADQAVWVSSLSGHKIVAVSTGGSTSMALLANGTVKAWGQNTQGQLGDGHANGNACGPGLPCSKTAETVIGLSHVQAIATGDGTSFALLEDGTVESWGWNIFGQLGDGSTTKTKSLIPVPVTGLQDVKSISAGEYNEMALLSDGTVMTWGDNLFGELGIGTETGPSACRFNHPCASTPVSVPGLSDVVQIAAGSTFDLALTADGTVYAWGYNFSGEAGIGTSGADVDSPTAITGMPPAIEVSAGDNGLALLADGTVDAWGPNGGGELGDGSNTGPDTCDGGPCAVTPQPVPGLQKVGQVSDGMGFGLALLDDGTVMGWGQDYSSQLGDGTTPPDNCKQGHDQEPGCSKSPVTVSTSHKERVIAAGETTSLALP